MPRKFPSPARKPPGRRRLKAAAPGQLAFDFGARSMLKPVAQAEDEGELLAAAVRRLRARARLLIRPMPHRPEP
jgi:hypothetical protein